MIDMKNNHFVNISSIYRGAAEEKGKEQQHKRHGRDVDVENEIFASLLNSRQSVVPKRSRIGNVN